MQTDLSNRVELQRLLQHFYELVLNDSIIGYLFVDIAKIDLDSHLPKVVDFWHDMLFKSNDYQGELYAAHAHIHAQVPLKPGHFTRWLYLLEKSLRDCDYEGEKADRLLWLAHRIAKSMSAGLNQSRRDTLVLSLAELKKSSKQSMNIDHPETHLGLKVPNALLVETRLANTDGVRLWLINADYPQDQLADEQVEELMDEPPYWAFCWASGWVLAQLFAREAHYVAGKYVVDFGCGSGVAGIAALKNGAQHVYFCDNDRAALSITQRNLELNGINSAQSSLLSEYSQLPKELLDSGAHQSQASSLILIADVFYDRDNLGLLAGFMRDFDEVLLADSRLKGQSLDGLTIVEHWPASTIPDLHESSDFNTVVVYRKTPWASCAQAQYDLR